MKLHVDEQERTKVAVTKLEEQRGKASVIDGVEGAGFAQ